MADIRTLAKVLIPASVAIAMTIGAKWEGKSNMAYPDLGGVWTICRGHTAGVKPGDYKTDAECDKDFRDDMGAAQMQVNRLVKVPLSDRERAAYTDFVYNAGAGNFASSTMLRKLNAGDYQGACDELSKWAYVHKVYVRGLAYRRADEHAQCDGEG